MRAFVATFPKKVRLLLVVDSTVPGSFEHKLISRLRRGGMNNSIFVTRSGEDYLDPIQGFDAHRFDCEMLWLRAVYIRTLKYRVLGER